MIIYVGLYVSSVLQSEVRKMNEMIFEVCYLALFMSGFFILLGLGNLAFDIVYKYVPRFRKWADDFIGIEDEESEAEYE